MDPAPASRSLLRPLTVSALLAAVALALLALAAAPLGDALDTWHRGTWRLVGFEDLLVWACALAVCVVVLWLWLGSLAVVLSVAGPGAAGPRGGRPDRVASALGTPGWARRAVLVGCGVALASPAVAPALAASGSTDPRPGPAEDDAVTRLIAGLPLPDRTPGQLLHRAAGAAPEHRERVVTVRPGDSLWSIARRDVGAGATEAAVAERWPVLWARNAGVIGPDPDLLQPGQRIVLPPLASGPV